MEQENSQPQRLPKIGVDLGASRPWTVQVPTLIKHLEELAEIWHEFLDKKFSQTELEQGRKEFEELADRKAMMKTTNSHAKSSRRSPVGLKNSKATGIDQIPAEVWKTQ